MATGAAVSERRGGRHVLAAAALFAVALLCLLYLFFLYQVYSDPSLRQSGLATASDIRNISALVFVLMMAFTLVVWMRWVPAGTTNALPPAGTAAGRAGPPREAGARAARTSRLSVDDPASRPGAPASLDVPAVPPDALAGDWKRYRFPAERTGGVYIDTDVVVDDLARAPVDPETPRGRLILRMRDEVARVCVRCELIDHCHGKVAALISREEMLANFECVPGLKRIAGSKIDSIRAARAKEAPSASSAPSGSPPPPPSGALQPTEGALTPGGDATAPSPDTAIYPGADSGSDSS